MYRDNPRPSVHAGLGLEEITAELAEFGGAFGPISTSYIHGNFGIDATAIATGRYILDLPGITWDSPTLGCPNPGPVWILDGQLLICPACGLDVT